MKTGLLKCFNAEYLDLWIEGQVYWTFTDNQRQNEFREERYWAKILKEEFEQRMYQIEKRISLSNSQF